MRIAAASVVPYSDAARARRVAEFDPEECKGVLHLDLRPAGSDFRQRGHEPVDITFIVAVFEWVPDSFSACALLTLPRPRFTDASMREWATIVGRSAHS